MPGQEPGKIQIVAIEVDTSKSYRSITVTDGYSNRKARVNGDWTANWKVGDIIDIIWIANEYPAGSGKMSYKLWEPKADSKKPTADTPTQAGGQVSVGMSIDEKKTNAWLIASTAFSGKFESVEDLIKMSRQVYSALYNSTAVPKKTAAAAGPATAHTANVVPAAQPPAPAPEPTPAPATLPIDFDTVEEDFEEDSETPF